MTKLLKFSLTGKIVLTVCIFIFFGSCDEKKANSIKLTAQQFRIEAAGALQQMKYINYQNNSLPDDDINTKVSKLSLDLESTTIDGATLDFLMGENNNRNIGTGLIDSFYNNLETQYNVLDDMFSNLSKGSYFAGNSVKKAEQYAIKLTIQFINFSNILKSYPVQFKAKRIILIEKITEIKKEKNQEVRKAYLQIAAKELLELSNEENNAREAAIRQCLKAAACGKLLAESIRNYNKLSINDLLSIANDGLETIAEMSNGNKEVNTILLKYNSIKDMISKDPYWSGVLDISVNK